MVITFICDVLGKPNNGTSIAVFNQMNAMAEKGHEVRCICPDEEYRGRKNFYICKAINFYIFNHYVAKNGVHPAAGDTKVLREALKGADIATMNFCGALSKKAVKICKEMGIPYVGSFNAQAENFTNHVFMMNFRPANWFIYRHLNVKMFSRLQAIHYPTKFIRDLFQEETGNNVKAYVVSNGVRKDFVHKKVAKPEIYKDKIIIVFSARYSKEKDPMTLLKAVNKSKYFDSIQLILPGVGPMWKKLEKFTSKWKNKPVFGFHSREELIDILNYADLYVHPSIIDLEAISALEAMATGLVPVLSDSPRAAIKTFALSEHNLFKMKDPVDLASKIDYWIEHPEEKEEYRKKYVEFAKKFDFDDAMDKMERMFLETIEEYKKNKDERK